MVDIVDINPKIVTYIKLGESRIFLISIHVPENASLGEYPLDFEIVSDEIMKSGKISLEIVEKGSIKDYLSTILNYKLLIYEITDEMLTAKRNGFDISLTNESLNKAKENLKRAEEYLKLKKYDNVENALSKTKMYIEDAVFQLAHAMLFVYIAPPFEPLFMIILFITMIVLGFFISWYKRKKKQKPRMLQKKEKK